MTRPIAPVGLRWGPALLVAGLCALADLACWHTPAIWRERGPGTLFRYALGALALGAGLAAHDPALIRPYARLLVGAGLGTAGCYVGHALGTGAKAQRRANLNTRRTANGATAVPTMPTRYAGSDPWEGYQA
jgi:hypothetical protein